MLSYAHGISLLSRGARWGDLEVLDLEDIEAQIAKNSVKVPALILPKLPAKPEPVAMPDLEAGWSVVHKERKKKPETRKANWNRKPCCSYFVETGKKHGRECKK